MFGSLSQSAYDGGMDNAFASIVRKVGEELKNTKKPGDCRGLKRIGRFALAQIEEKPTWAAKYVELFKERQRPRARKRNRTK